MISRDEVFLWRGGRKLHIFFYFLFAMEDYMPMKAKIYYKTKMKQIFKPPKGIENNRSIYACLLGVIFTVA